VAGAAPEWMSEKAISIGHYFVASGVYTVFGVTFPIVEETKFPQAAFRWPGGTWAFGKWGFTPDPLRNGQDDDRSHR
jgi:carbon-monoxide dehydrogenase catalytic subunit